VDDRLQQSGLGEGVQRGWAMDDAVAFRGMMLELYSERCAVTGLQPEKGAEVFLFQPPSHGGLLSTANALVVERAAASLLGRGLILISDDYMAFTPHPEIIGASNDPAGAGRRLTLPDDVSLWPDKAMLSYHRSLFRAQ
jgi:hypothetical protein